MANTYCENKSNKPVITKYDPSENYVVQMVESLASIDYPNENHIYVIESTGEKYIFYNGAFSKFEYDGLEPLVVTFNATYSSSGTDVYQYYYSDRVTYDKTYDEVKQAVEEGRPVYLKNANNIYVMSTEIDNNQIIFSDNFARRFQNNTQFETENFMLVMPKTGTYGTSTRIKMYVHNVGHSPLKITVTASNVTSTGHQYYTVWSSSNVTFSKTYTEIYNALRNGVPMVVTYDGLTKECIALQIDSSTIELSVCDAFLDTVPKPRYRTETFTIKSDNTGSYVKTLLSMNEVVTFTYGEPSTADMDFSKAVALHNSGNLLTAVVSMNGMTAVSKSYIYNGSIFIFALNVGMISGTVQWSSSGVTITINQ